MTLLVILYERSTGITSIFQLSNFIWFELENEIILCWDDQNMNSDGQLSMWFAAAHGGGVEGLGHEVQAKGGAEFFFFFCDGERRSWEI